MTGIYPERKRRNQNRALSVSAGSSRPKRRDLNHTRHLFMQNEPNFKNAKMNINYYPTTNYNENRLAGQQKNEPKRTQFRSHRAGIHLFMQNKANLQGGKMNITSYKTSNYNENCLTGESKNKPKTNPIKPNSPPKLAHMIEILFYLCDFSEIIVKGLCVLLDYFFDLYWYADRFSEQVYFHPVVGLESPTVCNSYEDDVSCECYPWAYGS